MPGKISECNNGAKQEGLEITEENLDLSGSAA
jgi:hypothetical protein